MRQSKAAEPAWAKQGVGRAAEMPFLLILVIGVVVAPVLGYFGTAAVCSVPGVRHSIICGHNAYVVFVVLVPIFFFGIVYWLVVRSAKESRAKPTV